MSYFQVDRKAPSRSAESALTYEKYKQLRRDKEKMKTMSSEEIQQEIVLVSSEETDPFAGDGFGHDRLR